MEQNKEAFNKLEECKKEINKLRGILNQLNEQKEEWFQEKGKYKQKYF